MRLVEWCIVTVVVAALPAGRTEAQNAAPVSAGVTRRIQSAASERPSPDSNRTSLRVHMIRGGEMGEGVSDQAGRQRTGDARDRIARGPRMSRGPMTHRLAYLRMD